MIPTIGDALQPFHFGPIQPSSMVTWSEILRDPNPIHLDPAAVQAMGLGNKRINQGPANLAYLTNAVIQSFPNGNIQKMTIRFAGNVLEDDQVVATGKVTAVDTAVTPATVTCDVQLDVEGRGPALIGTVIVALPQ